MGERWGELDTATLSAGACRASQGDHSIAAPRGMDGRVVSEMHSHRGEQRHNMEYSGTHQD